MKLTTLEAFYIEVLRNLYSAENQLLRALPKANKLAASPQLREAFTNQLHQSQAHIHRLEQIFLRLGVGPKGTDCRAMEGLIAEIRDLMSEEAQPTVMDAALIVAAQRIEHYQIAGCASACSLARHLEHPKAVEALQGMLDEKSATDRTLAEIATTTIRVRTRALNGQPHLASADPHSESA